MHINLICKKVTALLPLFIEDNLNEAEKNFVSEHLKICVNCRYKYENLKKLFSGNTGENGNSEKNNLKSVRIKEYEYYLQNLSAYCDNEMSFEEGVQFKKYVAKSPWARQDLKAAYKLREILNNNKQNLQKKM